MATDFSTIFITALSGLLMSLPLLIIWIVGIIVAIINRKKAPRKSLFALIGFGISLIVHIISIIFSSSFFLLAYQNGMETQMISTVNSVFTVFANIVGAIGWVCILLTIFGKEDKSQTNE